MAGCLVTAGLIGTPCVAANPMDMYGLGSRSIAMGSAVSADVEDFSANYYNPGGLVRGRRIRLEVGYLSATHALSTNGHDNAVDPAHGLVAGIVAPTRIFGVPFAFGLGLHVPDDRLARSRLLSQSQPRWELYDNRVQRLYFAANLAVAPFPWLRIGGGFSYIASTRGRLGLTGSIPATSAADSELYHTVDADVLAVYYPQFGAQIEPIRGLSLAAVYRGEFRFRLDIDADLNVDIVAGRLNDPSATRAGVMIGLQERAVTAFLPQQAVLGASWRAHENFTVCADVTWVDWSAYENPTAAVNASVTYEMVPGSENLPRPMIPPPVTPLPARFHDTLVPRVGIEWRHDLRAALLALRAGYRFDPSPVPDQRGVTNFLDSNRHVISAGAGVTLREDPRASLPRISLDVHGDVQVLERRVIIKDNPVDSVGDMIIGGRVVNIGVTLASSF